MSINILLIIIIVLLVLGLLLQLLQVVAIANLPGDLLDRLTDPYDLVSDVTDVIDVRVMESDPPTKSRGFGKSKQTKRSKRKADSSGEVNVTAEATEVKANLVE